MWKVLGVETILIDFDKVWIDQLFALSQRRKGSPLFREFLDMADATYFFDTIREVHMFCLHFPPSVTIDELEFIKEFIVKLYKVAKVPVVEYEGVSQLSSVVLSSEKEVVRDKKRVPRHEKRVEKNRRAV